MPFFGVSASGPSSMVSGGMAAGVGEWKYVVARHHELRDAFRARASFSWRRLPTLLAARIAAWGAGVGGTSGPLVEPATEPAITDRHLFEFEPSETLADHDLPRAVLIALRRARARVFVRPRAR